MRWRAIIAVGAALVTAPALPAGAFWTGSGQGADTVAVAVVGAAAQPLAVADGDTVLVTWDEISVAGEMLSAYAGGGYRVDRVPADGGPAQTACPAAATVALPDGRRRCTDSPAPFGEWRYSVTPLLGGFSGEAAISETIRVVPDAPVLDAAEPLAPAAGEQVGAIELRWQAVPGATAYRVVRRSGGDPVTLAEVGELVFRDADVTAGTGYEYAVHALAGSPVVASEPSAAISASPVVRPAAPTGVSATALPAGAIEVAWEPGETGAYALYRSQGDAAPVWLADVEADRFTDTSTSDGAAYRYEVRALRITASGDRVESEASGPSATVVADATAPPAPTVALSGGRTLSATTCGLAAGTRLVGSAGVAALRADVTAAAGSTVEVTATVGSAAVTGAAGPDGVATLDVRSLPDGALGVAAVAIDAAGNRSPAATAPGTAIKDTLPAALTGLSYANALLGADSLGGTSECGATIQATEIVGPNPGRVFPRTGTFTVTAGDGRFSGLSVEAATLTEYAYDVVATDLAGNASAPVRISGVAL